MGLPLAVLCAGCAPVPSPAFSLPSASAEEPSAEADLPSLPSVSSLPSAEPSAPSLPAEAALPSELSPSVPSLVPAPSLPAEAAFPSLPSPAEVTAVSPALPSVLTGSPAVLPLPAPDSAAFVSAFPVSAFLPPTSLISGPGEPAAFLLILGLSPAGVTGSWILGSSALSFAVFLAAEALARMSISSYLSPSVTVTKPLLRLESAVPATPPRCLVFFSTDTGASSTTTRLTRLMTPSGAAPCLGPALPSAFSSSAVLRAAAAAGSKPTCL